MKGETDKSAIIVGDFNTTLLATDENTRQKISKYKKNLNNMLKLTESN